VAVAIGTTYTLTCNGVGGTSLSSSVTVNVIPTVVLTVAPALVAPGGESLLTWSSTNATSCLASAGWTGSKAPSGSQSTGALAASTTYTLTCSGPGGTSAAATSTVVAGTLTIAPQMAALALSQAQQFTATVSGPIGALAWTVDGVAGGNGTAGTISASGMYTAGTLAGAHTVVATSSALAALSAAVTVAVTDLPGEALRRHRTRMDIYI
jgi:hypothetical protein